MRYDEFVERMQTLIQNPDPTADIKTFKQWEKGGITTRGAWRAFLRHNGWVSTDWRYLKDDMMFEWYLNSLGYIRNKKEEEDGEQGGEEICDQVEDTEI